MPGEHADLQLLNSTSRHVRYYVQAGSKGLPQACPCHSSARGLQNATGPLCCPDTSASHPTTQRCLLSSASCCPPAVKVLDCR